MKCLLDLDGVVVDFMKGALRHHGIANPYDDPKLHGIWDWLRVLGYGDEFWEPLGASFWANLDPMPDGFDILRIVENRFGKSNVCLLTQPCINEECMAGKMRWIKKHLPDYKSRYLMGPQKEFCAHPDHWLIDDADHNVNAFLKAGGRACLVPRIWNSLRDRATLPYLRTVLTSQNQEP